MLYTTTLLTAVGLAMAAVAVALAGGLSVKSLRLRDAFKMAAFFGMFQGLMPLLGYLFGLRLADVLATSIDVFAVGVSFSLLDTGLIATVAIIGIVTFALCLPAVWFDAPGGGHGQTR